MISYDESEEFNTLLMNGMFRNRENHMRGIPLSGSNLDGASWDRDEIAQHQEMIFNGN